MEELLDGVFRWKLPHPEWTPEDAEDGEGWGRIVASYLVETEDGPVLVDPLVGADGWEVLDGAIGGRTPHVVITLFWHTRSTPAVLERYPGAVAWVHEPAADLVRERGVEPRTFLPGDALPGALQAIDVHRAYEVAYLVPDRRALAVGDILRGATDGGARLLPRSWHGGDYDELCRALRDTLLPLAVEHLLLTHGDPVVDEARDALERALHSPPSAA